MARRPTVLPAIPPDNLPPAQLFFFNQVKESLEKLTGVRGDKEASAVLKGDISVEIPTIKASSKATGAAFNVGGVNLASGVDHTQLIEDFRELVQDVQMLRASVELLRRQLKGEA